MTTIRNSPFPQTPPRPQPQDAGKMEAQRAFFAAIAGKSAAASPTATQPTPAPAAPETTVRAAAAPAEPPQKILRPGSIIDIRV